jgi:2-polyprenyl-3-methyl-5-hydroxy-6-metoxy-1,4-benzoquinol methylase
VKLPENRGGETWTRIRAHDIEELWDTSRVPHVAAAYRARQEFMAQIVTELAGAGGRILDVGCAQGTLGLMLAERGLRVHLLDVRPDCIEYARARYEYGDVEFHLGMLSDTCPPARDYDVVVCTEVIEHVPEPASLLIALKRKVRARGAICLTTPNADYLLAHLPSYGEAPQATLDSAEANSLDGDAHRYLFNRAELVTLVRGAGLKLERHGFILPFWLEGHAKTRWLHRVFERRRGQLLRFPANVPSPLGRYLCSAQYVVARAEAEVSR